jgi:hypothetical protein
MSCEAGMHLHACSALVGGECKNGFPITRGCHVGHCVGPESERWWQLKPMPHCLNENYVRPFTSLAPTTNR